MKENVYLEFDELQNQIDKMYDGDLDAIETGLSHKGVLIRINALLAVGQNRINSSEIISSVIELKEDDSDYYGTTVGDYAKGVLGYLGIEKYTKKNPVILDLISSSFII